MNEFPDPGAPRPWLAEPRNRLIAAGAAGAAVILAAVLLYLAFGSSEQAVQAPPPPKLPPPPPPPPPKPKPTPHFDVTPRGAFAQDTFDVMRRKRVIVVGAGSPNVFLAPPDLRFKTLDSVDFIQKVAAFEKREVAWFRDGWAAFLYRKADAEKLERFLADIASDDPGTRAQAAWRARGLQDPKVVEPLLKAAQGEDYETARQARISLRRIGWEAALLVRPELALPLVRAELARADDGIRAPAAFALRLAGAQEALPLLVPLLAAEPDGAELPTAAARAFVQLGTPEALAQLDLMAAHDNPEMREGCARALADLPSNEALVLLKNLAKDSKEPVKAAAAYAIGCNPDPDKYPLFWDLFNAADPYSKTATQILLGLGHCDGEKPLAIFEHVLGKRNTATSVAVLYNLGRYGEKAWTLLDPEMATPRLSQGSDNSRPFVVPGEAPYDAAIQTLGHIADAKARDLLGQALAHKDNRVRYNALMGLCLIGDADAARRIDAPFAAGNYEKFDRSVVRYLLEYPREVTFPVFEKAFQAQFPNCDWDLMAGLAKTGGDYAKLYIEQAMKSTDAKVRARAMTAMADMDGEWVQEKLTATLHAAPEDIPSVLYLSLGAAGDERALLAIEAAVSNPTRVMSTSEMNAMGLIGGRRALAHVLRFLKAAKGVNLIQGAVALARIVPDLAPSDYPDARAAAEAALLSKDHTTREHACRALMQCGDDSSVPALMVLIHDGQAHVSHKDALLALAAIGTEVALEGIALELSCKNHNTHNLAIRLLGNSRQPAGRDLLIEQSKKSNAFLPLIRQLLVQNWPQDIDAQNAVRLIETRIKR